MVGEGSILGSFFVWNATHNKILTIDNLSRRLQVFVNCVASNKCDMENVGHLLSLL